MAPNSKVILLSIFLSFICRVQGNGLPYQALAECLAISQLTENPPTVQVAYTMNQTPISFCYDAQTGSSDIQTLMSGFQDLGTNLLASLLKPKMFSHTYSNSVLTVDFELESICDFLPTILEGTELLHILAEGIACPSTPAIENLSITVPDLDETTYNGIVACSEIIIEDINVAIQNLPSSATNGNGNGDRNGDRSNRGGKDSAEIAAITLGVLFGLTLVGLIIVSVLYFRRRNIG